MDDAAKRQQILEMADKFITLGNDLIRSQDLGTVGAAFRYAAARFAAFEAHQKTQSLASDKAGALEWFSTEYRKMLLENLDDYIATDKAGKAK